MIVIIKNIKKFLILILIYYSLLVLLININTHLLNNKFNELIT